MTETESEAIKLANKLYANITSNANNIIKTNDYIDFVRIAINALEKQIPKKPIMKQYYDDMEEEYLCCPTCGEILTDRIPLDNKDFYFHCLNCGQKLNWESDEE